MIHSLVLEGVSIDLSKLDMDSLATNHKYIFFRREVGVLQKASFLIDFYSSIPEELG